jgi:mono/diheme cytochrome c family protein
VLRKTPAAVILLAIAALAAVGCAKGSSSSSSATPAAGGSSVAGVAVTGDPTRGKAIFAQNCAQCHGATGTEGGVGPSLRNERARKNLPAAIAWIKDPQPPMPKLYPSPLSDKDVVDVAAYVESL